MAEEPPSEKKHYLKKGQRSLQTSMAEEPPSEKKHYLKKGQKSLEASMAEKPPSEKTHYIKKEQRSSAPLPRAYRGDTTMAEEPPSEKTHYIKKEQRSSAPLPRAYRGDTTIAEEPETETPRYEKKEQRSSSLTPWAYRDHKEQKKLNKKQKMEDSLYESLDVNTFVTTFEPLITLEKKKKRKRTKIQSDPYVAVRFISGLSGSTFQEFIQQKDAALVFFYNSSISAKGDAQDKCKKQFIKAAEITNRDNHAYAAMDCFKNQTFCLEESVKSFPQLRLYSRGTCLGSVKDVYSATDNFLRGMVEEAPLQE